MVSEPGALTLSAALSETPRTRPLIDGRVSPQGVRLVCSVLHGSEVFWRQLRFGDFDISDMSMSSLLISAASGDNRWVAIPVFTMRRFFHTGILVRADAGIKKPQDLAGKRVAVPEYQQTSAIWSRGILQDEFKVSPTSIEWFMERGPDKSHGAATGFVPPAGVRLNQIPPTTNIGEMLLSGELDATLLYLNEKNLVDRSSVDLSGSKVVVPLFSDPAAEGRRFYASTGLYPINHTIVLRRELHEKHPWLALNLFTAFVEAKEEVRRTAEAALASLIETGKADKSILADLRNDPLSYGMKGARRELETVARYVHEQGLTKRLVKLEEVFAPSVMDL